MVKNLELFRLFIIEEHSPYFMSIEFDFSKIVMFNVIFNVFQIKKSGLTSWVKPLFLIAGTGFEPATSGL